MMVLMSSIMTVNVSAIKIGDLQIKKKGKEKIKALKEE